MRLYRQWNSKISYWFCALTIIIVVASALVLSHILFNCFSGPIRNMVLLDRIPEDQKHVKMSIFNKYMLPTSMLLVIKFKFKWYSCLNLISCCCGHWPAQSTYVSKSVKHDEENEPDPGEKEQTHPLQDRHEDSWSVALWPCGSHTKVQVSSLSCRLKAGPG